MARVTCTSFSMAASGKYKKSRVVLIKLVKSSSIDFPSTTTFEYYDIVILGPESTPRSYRPVQQFPVATLFVSDRVLLVMHCRSLPALKGCQYTAIREALDRLRIEWQPGT